MVTESHDKQGCGLVAVEYCMPPSWSSSPPARFSTWTGEDLPQHLIQMVDRLPDQEHLHRDIGVVVSQLIRKVKRRPTVVVL